MASVLCYCGETFRMDGTVAVCPRCCAVATFPHVTGADAGQMKDELDRLIAGHEPDPKENHRP